MSKEQFLSEIEQIVREWNGLERGHLESALKVAVMRSLEPPKRQAVLIVEDGKSLARAVDRILATETHLIKQPVVSVPAIVEVEGLRELVQKWLNEAQRKQVMSHPCAHYEANEISRLAHELIAALAAAAPQSGEGKKG